jgi:hypothetical protein
MFVCLACSCCSIGRPPAQLPLCKPRDLILSPPSGSKTFEMADANAVPGRIDILTFLELRWSLACLWIFYNTNQLHRFSQCQPFRVLRPRQPSRQDHWYVRLSLASIWMPLPLVLGTLEEEEDHWSYGPTCYFQPYWFCKLFSTVNCYGKASSSQPTTFENMPNEGRETRSGSIRMCKIPGRYKSWCKRAWKSCNVWRWVNETEFICSCTLFPLELGGYWERIV